MVLFFGLMEGSLVSIIVDEKEYSFPVKIQDALTNGIALMPIGLQGMNIRSWGIWIKIEKLVKSETSK